MALSIETLSLLFVGASFYVNLVLCAVLGIDIGQHRFAIDDSAFANPLLPRDFFQQIFRRTLFPLAGCVAAAVGLIQWCRSRRKFFAATLFVTGMCWAIFSFRRVGLENIQQLAPALKGFNLHVSIQAALAIIGITLVATIPITWFIFRNRDGSSVTINEIRLNRFLPSTAISVALAALFVVQSSFFHYLPRLLRSWLVSFGATKYWGTQINTAL